MEYLGIITNTVSKQWTIIMHSDLSRLRNSPIGVYLNHPSVETCVLSIDKATGPSLLWHTNIGSHGLGLTDIYLQTAMSVHLCISKYKLSKMCIHKPYQIKSLNCSYKNTFTLWLKKVHCTNLNDFHQSCKCRYNMFSV